MFQELSNTYWFAENNLLERGKILISTDLLFECLNFPPFGLFPDDGRPCFLMENLAKRTFTSRGLILQSSAIRIFANYRVFQELSTNYWFARNHSLERGKILDSADILFECLKFPPFGLFPDDGRKCFLMNNLAMTSKSSRSLSIAWKIIRALSNALEFQAISRNNWFRGFHGWRQYSNTYLLR